MSDGRTAVDEGGREGGGVARAQSGARTQRARQVLTPAATAAAAAATTTVAVTITATTAAAEIAATQAAALTAPSLYLPSEWGRPPRSRRIRMFRPLIYAQWRTGGGEQFRNEHKQYRYGD